MTGFEEEQPASLASTVLNVMQGLSEEQLLGSCLGSELVCGVS